MTTAGSDWIGAVGRGWAREWPRTDRSFRELTPTLLAAATARLSDEEPARVLDVGCGAGETALTLAARLPLVEVVGVELSPDLAAVARARCDAAGLSGRVTVVEADAARWSGPPVDLVLSRHGVMFFDDPVAAFAHLRHGTLAGGALVFSCFRERALNPWASLVADLLPVVAPADPHAPGPFAFADEARVASLLDAAGWREVAIAPVDFAYVAGEGDDPVGDALAMLRTIGPAAAAMRELDNGQRAMVEGMLAERLARYRRGPVVAIPAAAWMVSAVV